MPHWQAPSEEFKSALIRVAQSKGTALDPQSFGITDEATATRSGKIDLPV
jgi:hypothetical protein